MKTITITIDTDNAAFEPDTYAELARILKTWIARGCQAGKLPLDVNGNSVGTVEIEDKDEASA